MAKATTKDETQPRRRLELLAADQHLPLHTLAGVKTHRRWDDASEVTEAELAAAIAEIGSITLR